MSTSTSSNTADAVPPVQIALLQSATRTSDRVSLRHAVVRIGRAVAEPQDIQLQPDDVHASREHAKLLFEEDSWFIEDHSRNGTFVNGKLLHNARARLKTGDRIQIGDSFDMTFRYLSDTTQSTLDEAGASQRMAQTVLGETPATQEGVWISPSAAVWRDGVRLPVYLSRTEYRLLKYLMQHPGDVCEYEDVIHAVWGSLRDKDSLHELIYRVRRKIEPHPSQPRYLVIRSGIGVVLFPQGMKRD